MAWIESHQNIERHPKTMRLSILMGWDIDQTIGKLHRLWWWCIDFAPDGNVGRHSADMVALAVGISADMGEKFILAMHESGFLDKTNENHFLIHDWMEYAGRYLKDTKYRRNPEKIQEINKLYSKIVGRQSADNPPKKRRKSAVPNLTLPNQPNLTNKEVVVFILPEWINADSWSSYEEMRKEKKKVPTDRARRLVVKELEKLKAQGHDPNECLNQSTRNGWTDVYPIKSKSSKQFGEKTHAGIKAFAMKEVADDKQ